MECTDVRCGQSAYTRCTRKRTTAPFCWGAAIVAALSTTLTLTQDQVAVRFTPTEAAVRRDRQHRVKTSVLGLRSREPA